MPEVEGAVGAPPPQSACKGKTGCGWVRQTDAKLWFGIKATSAVAAAAVDASAFRALSGSF